METHREESTIKMEADGRVESPDTFMTAAVALKSRGP